MSPIAWPVTARRRGAVRFAFLLGVSLVGASASAGEFTLGLGGGFDHGRVDCLAPYACDRNAAHAKLFVGDAFANGLELQALIFDAGHFDGGDSAPLGAPLGAALGTPFGGRFKVGGIGLAAGYSWHFAPGWSLKGQLGAAKVRTRFAYAAPFSGGASKTTTQPLGGLSLGWRAAPMWQLSLDYDETRFRLHTTRGSLRMLGVSAHYTF